ncbi:MAG: ribosome biogenesis GTP-binding protein YsxC [Deltaproteobacteria bacterium]|nr:ribosome biogenesis GTP-binding protein YsxC [Deltaproteobacteria bacterium]
MSGPTFIISAAKLSQCPPEIEREVAVIGRSNVGKSSLLAQLLGQQSLVRRSRTPGRTQLINYFKTSEGDTLVDLPGYGFADVPNQVKAGLEHLVESYLRERDQLALVLLLIDARRAKGSDDDRAHLAFVQHCGRRVIVIVTKIDRLAKAKRKPTLREVEKSLDLPAGSAIGFSAETGDGLGAVRKAIQDALRTIGDSAAQEEE